MSGGTARPDAGAPVLVRLRAVQDLDRQIHSLRRSIESLPGERDERAALLAAKEEALSACEAREVELQMGADAVELDIKEREARLAGLAVKVNTVRDTAQMLAIQNEMRSLEKANGADETRVLEAMEAIETASREAREAGDAVGAERSDHAAFLTGTQKDETDWTERISELEGDRSTAAAALDGDTLAHYERLFLAREGSALAECRSGQCQGCFTSLPRNVTVLLHHPETLTTCPTCSRILYLEEED